MTYETGISVTPEIAASPEELKKAAAKELRISAGDIAAVRIVRRAIDARRHRPQIQLILKVFTSPEEQIPDFETKNYQYTENRPPVIIVGAGPAGLFAAMKLLERGLRPVILERGKDVSERSLDIASLAREHRVNPDSNWCFGEGGAGTFSDGKLYTRSNKRGNIGDVLQQLVAHGANPDILVDSHAHIGTDKLPEIIANIRRTIVEYGGIYRFNTRVSDFIIKNNAVQGVIDTGGTKYEGIAVILATGHSARDIYELFDRNNLALEAKNFAMGVRVEHPQTLINEIQYGKEFAYLTGEGLLPPATYSLVTQAGGRGVFSFCMCPGGIMVPAATGPESLVVNGMSNSRRNSPYANSGIAVQIGPAEYQAFSSGGSAVLAGLRMQQELEYSMFVAANRSQAAPSQNLPDFVRGRSSSQLLKTSHLAGNTAAPLHALLPAFMVESLQEAFRSFDKKMRGFLSSEAVITAVESRTSSPVRIPRDAVSLQHPQLARLYPCGEGAGYAGGITSSAIDGIRCAERIVE